MTRSLRRALAAASSALAVVGVAGLIGTAHAGSSPTPSAVKAAPAVEDGAPYWSVATDHSTGRLLGFSRSATDWNAEPTWSWSPLSAGFADEEQAVAYPITDFRRRVVGRAQRMVVSSGKGLIAVVSLPGGRRTWATTVPDVGIDAVELLPTGAVAAVSRQGWVRVYAPRDDLDVFAQVAVPGATGVLWDPTIERLWVLGTAPTGAKDPKGNDVVAPTLTALEVVSGGMKAPQVREDATRRRQFPSASSDRAVDLAADGAQAAKLWVTSGRGVVRYDTVSGEVDAGSGLGPLSRAGVGSTTAVPGLTAQTTAGAPDTVEYFAGDSAFAASYSRTRTGAEFARVRFWDPNYTAAGPYRLCPPNGNLPYTDNNMGLPCTG